MKRFIATLKRMRGFAVQQADLRRKDHPAYMAVGVADRGVEMAGKVVFWLKMDALLFIVLIIIGILNLIF